MSGWMGWMSNPKNSFCAYFFRIQTRRWQLQVYPRPMRSSHYSGRRHHRFCQCVTQRMPVQWPLAGTRKQVLRWTVFARTSRSHQAIIRAKPIHRRIEHRKRRLACSVNFVPWIQWTRVRCSDLRKELFISYFSDFHTMVIPRWMPTTKMACGTWPWSMQWAIRWWLMVRLTADMPTQVGSLAATPSRHSTVLCWIMPMRSIEPIWWVFSHLTLLDFRQGVIGVAR